MDVRMAHLISDDCAERQVLWALRLQFPSS
jgi:hypothetical protein